MEVFKTLRPAKHQAFRNAILGIRGGLCSEVTRAPYVQLRTIFTGHFSFRRVLSGLRVEAVEGCVKVLEGY